MQLNISKHLIYLPSQGGILTVKLLIFNLHPLEVVSPCRDQQPKVAENCSYLLKVKFQNICKFSCLNTHVFLQNRDLIGKN